MDIIERIKDIFNPKSAYMCKKEILRELSKHYRLEPVKKGERPRWWNVIAIDGEKYYVLGCEEKELKVFLANARRKYNAERIGLYGELAEPAFRPARI